MGSAAKGLSGITIEQATTAGMLQLLGPTAISALPVSATTGIPAAATTGMRIVLGFYGHTATGTVQVSGTSPYAHANITETTTTIPLVEKPGEVYYYTTTAPFASIASSGIGTAISGLTNGTVVVYGVQAGKRMILGETKLIDKFKEYSPQDQRGSFDADYNLVALSEAPEWEFAGDLRADDDLWFLYGAVNSAPTFTSIPAAPVVIHASASIVTSGSESATSQPTAPGMVIQCVIGGAPATAATVSITGTNVAGETITEVVTPSTLIAGTYTSSTVFASIAASGIVWGNFGGSATLTVNAYFGWSVAGSPADTLATFAIEQYDSTASFIGPLAFITEIGIEGGADKEAKVSAKGMCQQVLPVGDITSTANQVTAFGQVYDEVLSGWRALVFVDPVSGTIGTTQQPDVVDWKVAITLDQTAKYTSWGNPPNRMYNRVYRKRRRIKVEATLDMTSTTYQNEYKAWKNRSKRLLQLQIIGPIMGTAAGTTYYKGFTLNVPLRWIEAAERDFTSGKDSVEVKVQGVAEYSPALGYTHSFTWYTQFPSWNLPQ